MVVGVQTAALTGCRLSIEISLFISSLLNHYSAALKHLTAVTGNRTTVTDNNYRAIDLHDVSALSCKVTYGGDLRLCWQVSVVIRGTYFCVQNLA